jgi:hypothetical protein
VPFPVFALLCGLLLVALMRLDFLLVGVALLLLVAAMWGLWLAGVMG